jgi:carotenoid 1,2-hydratase
VPTLPLLLAELAPTDADAPRHVTAPGGYEWWYFEAHDPVADLRVTAILFDGNPFHPGYLRRYAWYRRFPTRLRPPLPREYPCTFVRVYEKGEPAGGGMWQYDPGACRATRGGVRVGPDGFTRLPNGSMRLTVRRSIDLTFAPKAASATAPHVYEMARGASVVAPHGWIVSNPMCAVAGEVMVRGRSVRFDGLGYQDHNFGAEPVSLVARRWFWGCAWIGEHAHVVAEVVGRREQSWGVRWIDATTLGSATWGGRTSLRVPYPTVVDFGDALRLDEPRVVESLPIFVQLRYRAQVNGVTTTALAHVVEPGRAAWPVVGSLYERLIERRAGSERA